MEKSPIIHIIPTIFEDERGYFSEVYSLRDYRKKGIDGIFLQDNHSISYQTGTLRGLHFQAPPNAQAKLVRCSRGSIFDVGVDIRIGSPSYGQWKGFELSADNGHQLYFPIGFAHGFVTLEPQSEIVYKCTDYYSPQTEGSLIWNDPDIGIEWPIEGEPILSIKDSKAPSFKKFKSPFIYGVNS